MSKSVNKKILMMIMFVLLSIFMWGCGKSSVRVDNIYFNFESGEHVALMVGEELDLSNYVTIVPSFATNKEYVVSSLNEQVVSVEGKTIKALEPGYAIIKVVAKDNKIKESSIVVVVKQEKETLAKPQNLRYDEATQTILFDAVDFASSYTLRIDGEEIDLGTFTTYSLKGSPKQKLDQIQVVQVKANAAQYSQAFESSGFTGEFKIYQSKPAENFKIENGFGVLGAVGANSEIKVLIDDEVLIENLKVNTFSISDLNEKFAGREVKISVVTKIQDSLKNEIKADVYCSGITSIEKIKVLGDYELSLNGNLLEWTKDELISKYELKVDSKKVADCVTNSYNLATLTDFDNSFNKETEVEVKPVLVGSLNIAKTTKENKIKIKKLTKPEIQFNQTKVEWGAVDYADGYSVEIKNLKTGSKLSSYMLTNSIDMKNYDAGEYSISVTAISNGKMQEDKFCYLSSKTSSRTFKKHESLSLSMENGFLKINDSDSGLYALEFDDAKNNIITSEKSIDLKRLKFKVKINSVKVTKLGGDSNIDGDCSEEYFFTQLEDLKDGDVSLQNNTISIVKSENNKNATIEIVVCKVEGQTQTELFSVQNDSYQFNSTDDSINHLLSAGKYIVKIYVLGDGSTSLSVRDDQGANKVSIQREFEVLACPAIDVDIANKMLTMSEIANAKSYLILDSENNELQNEPLNQYNFSDHDFETVSELKLYVQARGDGESFLDSYKSEEILIKQLATPSIQFSSATNKITKQDSNTQGVKDWLFKVNGKIVENYDFLSAYEFDENVNEFNLSLTAVAKAGEDNKFFINSEESKKTLKRILNEATISLDGIANNLVIAPASHNQEFNIKLNVICNGQIYALSSVGHDGVLSNGELNFKYTYTDNKYVVELMQNNQPIVEDMKQGFDVEVQFINMSDGDDDLIDSNIKTQNGLKLFKVENETSISLNDNGQLEIKNNKYSEQLNLILVVEDREFKPNEAGTILVSDSIELPVKFNDGTYVVNLLNEQFNAMSTEFDSEFNVQVKYCKELESGSFADSDLSEVFTFAVEMASSLSRDEQTIIIANVQPTYGVDNYKLLIDGVAYGLSGVAAKNADGNIVVGADFVFEKIKNKTEATSINAITVGGETSLIKKGYELKIKQAETPSFVSNKDNNSSNNSAVITLQTTNAYSAQYVVDCYANDILEFSENYYYDDAVAGVYFLNVDEKTIDLSGNIKFKAYALADGQDGDVEVFDSSISEVEYTKLENVSGISISDDLLTFNAVEHAVGYEIYIDGTKLNPQLITEARYDVSAIDVNCKLQIKAISEEIGFTNSDLTTELAVTPLTNPTIEFENGVAKIKVNFGLASLLTSKDIIPQITNSLGEKIGIDVSSRTYDVKIVASFTGITVYVQPYVFMKYNTNPLSAEEVNFQLVVNSNVADECYINSPKQTFNLHGLLAPVDVKRATNSENNGVEFITWKANPANVINGTKISEKYILKIVKNGVDYYSNESKLKFKAGEDGYSTYGDFITSPSANFPSFYDADESGTLTEGDVEFSAGDYDVYVQAVPNTTLEGVTICGSDYSESCEFEIMESPDLRVENGGVKWNADSSAAKYEIKVYQGDDLKAKQVNVVSTDDMGNAYDFNSATLASGVYKVCVRAISNKESVLNSKDSEIYVYRLNKATELRVDDGDLILSANGYFTSAKIDFVKDGKALECSVFNKNALNNLENLDITTWKDFAGSLDEVVDYRIKVDNNLIELLSGDYTINITLEGNSNTELGLITSSKVEQISQITTSKLGINSYSVKKGVVKFEANNQYATYNQQSESVEYEQLIDLHYNFGNGCYCPDFWNNTIIYKIVVNNSHEIYAVDYYSLLAGIEKGLIADTVEIEGIGQVACLEKNAAQEYQYVKYNDDIKFNVFVNNEFNLRDVNEIKYFSKSSVESTLNLATGGNYDVKIYMLGGDSFEENGVKIGTLTAETPTIQQFNRYATPTFTIVDGKLNFKKQSLIADDAPVYRFEIVKDGTSKYIYYLFTNSRAYAESVAQKYDGDLSSEGFVQEYLELTNYDKNTNNYIFDLSAEFDSGTFNLNLTVLVGERENAEREDYFLNSQPCSDIPIFKPADIEVSILNGELNFSQASIVKDKTKEYLNDMDYEIVIIYQGAEHVYTVDKTSAGIYIDNKNKVIYNIPQFVSDLEIVPGENYGIKVRTKPKENAYSDILNGTFAKNAGSEDQTLTFSRLPAVSDVKINNGQIEWLTNSNSTQFGVLLTFSHNGGGSKQVVITDGYNVEDGEAKLIMHDGKYPLYREMGMLDILDKDSDGNVIDYSVEVFAIGNNENIINSVSVSGETFNRLSPVDKDSIKTTSLGLLTWDAVDGAVGYEINAENETKTYMGYSASTLFSFEEHQLPVGNYAVSVRAIGSSMLNAVNVKSQHTFVQLGQVNEKSIKVVPAGAEVQYVNSGVVQWDAVEGCSSYYIAVTFNETEVYEQIVSETNMLIPIEINGDFTVDIAALTNESNTGFRSEFVRYTSSTYTPNKVESAMFNDLTQSLNIKAELLSSDKIVVNFNFEEYQAGGIASGQQELLEIPYNSDQNYSITLRKMGIYRNVMVKVVRGNASSAIVNVRDIDLKVLAYGEGTEANPYVITNSTHLLNMKYYNEKDVHFKLGGNINMSGVIQSRLENSEQNNSMILNEFNAVLDGAGFAIYEFNYDELNSKDVVDLTDKLSFALFGKLNKATIKNLVIGKENIPLYITASFTGSTGAVKETDFTFAMLALSSENSTISNVVLKNVILSIKGSVKLKGNINIAGLIAKSKNDLIEECAAGFKVDLGIDFANSLGLDSNVAALIADAEGDIISDAVVNFEMVDNRTNNPMAINNVGGVIAYSVGVQLSNVKVETKVLKTKCLNFGGVASYADAITIAGCDVTVVFGGESADDKYRVDLEQVYYGGVAGYAINDSVVAEDDRVLNISFNINFSGNYVNNLFGYKR